MGIKGRGVKITHQFFRRHIYKLPLVLNLVPGAGTLAAALLNLCFGLKKLDSACWAFSIQVLTALLQVLTAPLLIGIVWSLGYVYAPDSLLLLMCLWHADAISFNTSC